MIPRNALTRRRKSSAAFETVSLSRALSKLGYASRSDAKALITAGRVQVGNRIVLDPAWRCNLRTAQIAVDGMRIRRDPTLYVMLNKPKGVITTVSDERGRKTVYSLLHDVPRRVVPIGRLDKDSEGILLLTNDLQLGNYLTSPQTHVPKTYAVWTDRPLPREAVEIFRSGMLLHGERLQPAHVRVLPMVGGGASFMLTIFEGKNRQIRRMCASFGCTVTSLVRTSVGPLTLGKLQSGAWRYLNVKEIDALRELQRRGPVRRFHKKRNGVR